MQNALIYIYESSPNSMLNSNTNNYNNIEICCEHMLYNTQFYMVILLNIIR